MAATSNDVANEAIQLAGDNIAPVTGYAPSFDSSPAGKALAQLYVPAVQTIARQFAWDFTRTAINLTLSGNPAPLGWAYEYLYPPLAVELWQVLPPTQADPNNPLPVNWSVANNVVNAVSTKVIWTNQVQAYAVYNGLPPENTWDPLFREAVVRLLASELAAAIAGKPDMVQAYLESGSAFESIGEGRPD